MKRWLSGLLAAVLLLGMTACGGPTGSAGEHEPITIMDASRDYSALLDLLHEQYPEVQVQIQAYRGGNMSAYMAKQLKSGEMPDIYSTTYAWDTDWQKEHLIDLSRYAVTDLYNEVRMDDTDVDGATYLIPYDFNIVSICCNKSLLERHGWSIPQSFAELEALAPQIKAAGVELSACQLDLPGFPFQYFCNVADTTFLHTVEGQQWQQAFLDGTASADALQSSAAYLQKWIDLGMLNTDSCEMGMTELQAHFYEGNTAFYLGNTPRLTQNADGTGDQYVCMPYLSQNGGSNMYILQVGRYYGLSKTLAEPGNEQKLEDALHFLEVLSTMEGYEAVRGSSSMCTLKTFSVSEDSPYYHALEDLNSGHSAPLVYSGWEDYLTAFGDKVREWIAGDCTGADALAYLDSLRQQRAAGGGSANICAEVTETLDTEQTAKLVGRIFMEAADADAALISRNEWKPGVNALDENTYGVNGTVIAGALSRDDIVSFLPSGWYGTIWTETLTGKQVNELHDTGFDLLGSGDTYPYTLVTKNGEALEDNTVYTVVVCGATQETDTLGSAQDTGIVGLDAAERWLKAQGTVSPVLLE